MRDFNDHLAALRRSYAMHISGAAGIDRESEVGRAITAAYESVPREQFVGPPPWLIISPEGHYQGLTSNIEDLYRDVLVSLDPGKGLNNGQPSLHAFCLNALVPRPGEHAVHVGAGTGYYTSILATLVGAGGRVDAYEIEPELGARATENLRHLSQVETHVRSGAIAPFPESDVIYVSAASSEPLEVWLDALRSGGRLLFPLEPDGESGEMLLVNRQTEQLYAARFLCGVQFVACLGTQDPTANRALAAAFRRGNAKAVKTLHRNSAPDESCWCAGESWWLSTR